LSPQSKIDHKDFLED
jgi:hypothetical protein